MDRSFPLTRDAGLAQLAAFLAGPGAGYAGHRNTDRGPLQEATTSGLSPYLRRRLVTEAEIVTAARDAFGEDRAEKFISEVFWRTYFKGHLETHPAAWTAYLAAAEEQRERLDNEAGLRRTYRRATEGQTGIDGFDSWVEELVETGWLHNHARMWFASIWIFTLRLPWELGAAFFLRHLVDGDPASNTLSWRWVAGLHTRGKHYVARGDNIERFTDGRFRPEGLNEHPDSLTEAMPPREVSVASANAAPAGAVALLLHVDDLHPESLPLGSARVARIGGMVASAPDAAKRVRAADEAAMADALERAGVHFGCPAVPADGDWAEGLPIVTAWAPVGPSAGALPAGCLRVRRAWDEKAWPLSNRGYSRLRAAIPKLR